MVLALNRPVSDELGQQLAEKFIEVVIAPEYDENALETMERKEATRILVDRERRRGDLGERVQTRDRRAARPGRRPRDRRPEPDGPRVRRGERGAWGDLLFAWRVCKHVDSNAIVIAKDLQTIGIGGGQTSRVDSVRIAIERRVSTATTSLGRCSPPTRSSRSRTALRRRSMRVSRRSSSPAERSGTKRWSRLSGTRAWPWSSPPPLPPLAASSTPGGCLARAVRALHGAVAPVAVLRLVDVHAAAQAGVADT